MLLAVRVEVTFQKQDMKIDKLRRQKCQFREHPKDVMVLLKAGLDSGADSTILGRDIEKCVRYEIGEATLY